MLYPNANYTVYYMENHPKNVPDNLSSQISFDIFYKKYHIFLYTAYKIMNDT